jgi:hypothetical protein
MKTLIKFVLPLLLLAAGPALAERSQAFGDVTVHYNAITTDTLTPDVARAYDITRSKYRGLLTVSVLKPNKLGMAQPVPAKIQAYTVNLSEQLRNISMREIREGTAIYYIGEFSVAPQEVLRFTVDVTAEGQKGVNKLEFQQTLLP